MKTYPEFWNLTAGEIQTLIRAGALSLSSDVRTSTVEEVLRSFSDTKAVKELGERAWAKIEKEG